MVKSSFPESSIANLFYLDRILSLPAAAQCGELWRDLGPAAMTG
jgi:hypothetical protein